MQSLFGQRITIPKKRNGDHNLGMHVYSLSAMLYAYMATQIDTGYDI